MRKLDLLKRGNIVMSHPVSRGNFMVLYNVSAQDSSGSKIKPGIVVYTSTGCPKCTILKEWLKANNRNFEEQSLENVDVMTNLVMRNFVILSAPVIEVNETIYVENQFFEGSLLSVNRLSEILEGQ